MTISIGIGILSWKGYDSLDAALQSYADADLFSLFDEQLLFLPEMEDQGQAIAKKYELPFAGSEKNLGILGGFKALASAMTSDIVLLLENDCPLIEVREEAARQFEIARKALLEDEVQVFRMRSRQYPGQKFPLKKKYARYFGEGALPAIRRILRSGKANRLAGGALYANGSPEKKFPQFIEKKPTGYFRVSTACLPWTNQSIMVGRQFFLDRILSFAETNPSNRTVNGFPDIEKEWNNDHWRQSGWFVGADKGLFTHERI